MVVKDLNEKQEQYSDCLDEVEINIIGQLNARHGQIIQILQDTVQSEGLVDQALEKVQALQQRNRLAKESLLGHSLSILNKKRRVLALTKTKQQLEMLSILKNIHRTVQDLIDTQSYHKAIELIDHYESLYSQRFRGLECLKKYSIRIHESKELLQKVLVSQFQASALSYVQTDFSYQKKRLDDYLYQSDSPTDSFCFPFVTSPSPRDPAQEQKIAELMLLIIQTKTSFPRNYKQKVGDLFKGLWKEFVADMLSGLQIKEEGVLKQADFFDRLLQDQDIRIYFHIQVLLFRLSSRLLQRQNWLNQTLLKALLQHVATQPQAVHIKVYQEIVNDQVHTFDYLVNFLLDKLSSILRNREFPASPLQDYNFQVYMQKRHWAELQAMIQENTGLEVELASPLNEDNKEVLSYLLNKYIEFSGTVSMHNSRTYVENEFSRAFIGRLAKHSLVQLRTSLEEETWVEAEQPYDFKQKLVSILDMPGRSHYGPHLKAYQLILDSFQLSESGPEEEDLKEEQHQEIQITQKNLVIYEQVYKIPESGVTLVEIMDQYVFLLTQWPNSQELIVEQLIQVVSTYNSMSCQLVLGAGSVGLQKIPSITAKIIAICCSTINLLALCMGLVQHRHPQCSPDRMATVLKDLTHHNQELKSKLVGIMLARIQQQTEASTKVDWSSSRLTTPTQMTAYILKDLRSLFNSIQPYFSQSSHQQVFGRIYTHLTQIYLAALSSATLSSPAACLRLSDEMDYFLQGIQAVGCSAFLPEMQTLEEAVLNIKVICEASSEKENQKVREQQAKQQQYQAQYQQQQQAVQQKLLGRKKEEGAKEEGDVQ